MTLKLTQVDTTTSHTFAVGDNDDALHRVTVVTHEEEELPRSVSVSWWFTVDGSAQPPELVARRYESFELSFIPEAVRVALIELDYLPDEFGGQQ